MRNQVWDDVRGVAIVAVVSIHAINGALSFPGESFDFQFGLIFRQVVNFAVPLFLAMAGLFAGSKSITHFGDYISSRAARILLPYLFWSAVYILLTQRGALVEPQKLFFLVATGAGMIIGYFVLVLMQMVLLTPLLCRITSWKVHAGLIAAVTVFGLLYTYVVQFYFADTEAARFPGNALPFFVWYPFYHLGFVIGRHGSAPLLRVSPLHLALLWGAALLLSVAEAEYLAAQGHVFAASQIKASSFVASTFAFLFCLRISMSENVRSSAILARIGRDSFFIYFFHLLTFRVVEKVFRSIPGVFETQILYVPLVVASSIAVCLLVAMAARSVLSTDLQTRMLGLVAERPLASRARPAE